MWNFIKSIFSLPPEFTPNGERINWNCGGATVRVNLKMKEPLICRKSGKPCNGKMLYDTSGGNYSLAKTPCLLDMRCKIKEVIAKEKEIEDAKKLKNDKLNSIFSNYEE